MPRELYTASNDVDDDLVIEEDNAEGLMLKLFDNDLQNEVHKSHLVKVKGCVDDK
jgi:hypothetical protein